MYSFPSTSTLLAISNQDLLSKIMTGNFILVKLKKITSHRYLSMLNQTNISANNNKFYKLQLIEHGGSVTLHARWGRVGEQGRNTDKPQRSIDAGIEAFKKQFKSKTANNWDDRENFTPKSKKYTLLEMVGILPFFFSSLSLFSC